MKRYRALALLGSTVMTAGIIAAGVASSAAATTSAPSAVIIDQSQSLLSIGRATVIANGGSTVIGGHLTMAATNGRPIVGAHLKLQVRTTPTGSFATIKTVLTSSTGMAHVTVRPAHTVWYRWSYAGNAGHGPVNSTTEKVTVGGIA